MFSRHRELYNNENPQALSISAHMHVYKQRERERLQDTAREINCTRNPTL